MLQMSSIAHQSVITVKTEGNHKLVKSFANFYLNSHFEIHALTEKLDINNEKKVQNYFHQP